MNERICPETGAVMQRGVRPMTLCYKGRSIVIDMPGWYADDDVTDSIHSGEDMKVSDRALHRLKAQAEGLLEPAEVGRIRRKKPHLSQREAGLGDRGGPNAFQKYEAGDVLVSTAISSALRMLDAYPDALAVLLAHQAELSAADPPAPGAVASDPPAAGDRAAAGRGDPGGCGQEGLARHGHVVAVGVQERRRRPA